MRQDMYAEWFFYAFICMILVVSALASMALGYFFGEPGGCWLWGEMLGMYDCYAETGR